jgi:cell division protein FtsQ
MTTATTRKRSNNKSAKNSRAMKPTARKKARRLSWFDRFIRTLPLSQQDLQVLVTWIGVGLVAICLYAAASYIGLPKLAFQQYAHLAAQAGFEVKRVEVTGMDRVNQLKVYEIVLSEKDRAMPLVDITKIRRDLLQYGWIKDVRVSRRLPDVLVVEIIERKPTAVWQREDKLALIDGEGVVLEALSPNTVPNLPVLRGEGANKQTIALAELLENAPSLKPQISGATWVGNRRWDLSFKSGETLALPEGEVIAAEALVKFAGLDGINRLLGRDLIYFDFRDPETAYLRKTPKAVEAKNDTENATKSDTKSDADAQKSKDKA